MAKVLLPLLGLIRVRLQHLKLTKVAHVPVVEEQEIVLCAMEQGSIIQIQEHIPVQGQRQGILVAHATALENAVYAMAKAL